MSRPTSTMIDEAAMLDGVAIRAHQDHVFECIIAAISVFVMKSKNLRMFAVPAPFTSINRDTTPFVGALEAVGGSSKWSCDRPTLATAKPCLVGLPTAYRKFTPAPFARFLFRALEPLASLLYSTFKRAISLGFSPALAGHEVFLTKDTLFDSLESRKVVNALASIGTKMSSLIPTPRNVEFGFALLADLDCSALHLVFCTSRSSHFMSIKEYRWCES